MVGDILQPTHLLFVLVVALLVLGPKRLPEVGRTLGNGLRDFRAAINGQATDAHEQIQDTPWETEAPPAAATATAAPAPDSIANPSDDHAAPESHAPAAESRATAQPSPSAPVAADAPSAGVPDADVPDADVPDADEVPS